MEENIEKYINNIKDIDKVEPMTHPYDLYLSSLRDDKVEESILSDMFIEGLTKDDIVKKLLREGKYARELFL